jgi:hypothetical protein
VGAAERTSKAAKSPRPRPGAYAPFVTVGSPSGKPANRPKFRVLLHKTQWKQWQEARGQVGETNIKELWDHLAYRADQRPLLGSVTALRGGAFEGKDGWSRVYHYELTGAARVDYQFKQDYVGRDGDAHPVVKIIRIQLGSH